VLLLGKRLDFTLKFGQAPALGAETSWLQVDADRDEIERTRRAVGDRLAATALATVIGDRGADRRGPPFGHRQTWLGEVRNALAYRPSAWDTARSTVPDRLHPVQMLRPLQAVLDSHPDAVFVCDGGEIGQWAQACLSAPHRVAQRRGRLDRLGPAFRAGRALAMPEAPVVAVMGDGTFGFHAAEFDTGVRCAAAVRRGGRQRRTLERRVPDPAEGLRRRALDRLRTGAHALRPGRRRRWAGMASIVEPPT
jgi:acetolactate synthase-1/2/3 large subunit